MKMYLPSEKQTFLDALPSSNVGWDRGTFQSNYFFQAITIQTTTSIWTTLTLTWKSVERSKLKKKKKKNTKIYKRASEENNTHAQ